MWACWLLCLWWFAWTLWVLHVVTPFLSDSIDTCNIQKDSLEIYSVFFALNLLTLASLSLAFKAFFSYLFCCLPNAVVLLDPTAIIGVEVLFICKFRPSPFELFHSDIAIRLYKICGKSKPRWNKNNFPLVKTNKKLFAEFLWLNLSVFFVPLTYFRVAIIWVLYRERQPQWKFCWGICTNKWGY